VSQNVFNAARVLIETRFKNGWSTRTPVKFESENFNQTGTSWVRLSIRWGESIQAGLGSPGTRLERHVGVIVLQIFAPVSGGTKTIADHADFAAALFRMVTEIDEVNGVEVAYQTPSRAYAGEEKQMRQENLRIPFQVDALF